MKRLNVGERNTRFVLDDLNNERIAVIGKDVLGVFPRKVCFFPASGKAMVKRLATTNSDVLAAQERAAALRARPIAQHGGSIDLS